jgi:diguanylate cyclase (GGDEF)-like protein
LTAIIPHGEKVKPISGISGLASLSNELGNATDRSEHETFQESIAELDQIVRISFLTTIVQIAAVLAAISAILFIGDFASRHYPGIVFVVNGIFLLMLTLLAFDLARHRRTNSVRDRLAKQLKVSVKQRIRADKLYDLSILDPLTGLHNRRFGEQRLAEEVARSERSGDSLAVLLFDLDYFKEINDQFGHAAGDAALKEFSRQLKRAIRACDIPVRIGGDEFLIILPECPREKINVILDRIGASEVRFNHRVISIRYSVGRAHYQMSDTSQTMLQRADQVLYAEKALRRQHSGTGDKKSDFTPDQTLAYQRPPSFRA